MNNAQIALSRIKDLHQEIVSLDSSNKTILKESRNIEVFINKASKDTNFYRKRLSDAYEILEKKQLDPAITNGLDSIGLNKDMIEDLIFARNKPVDKALEYLREVQQDIVDISISKRDLVGSTRQLERQLKNASEKMDGYTETLGALMTFLLKKGMMDEEMLQAVNGSKSSKAVQDAILELQKKK